MKIGLTSSGMCRGKAPLRGGRPVRMAGVLLAAVLLLVGDGLLGFTGDPGVAAGRRHRPKKLFKVATIAPEGSTWMKLMHEMDDRVQEETGGEVGFKFYPGGAQGSDLDVLRKIRSGQLQGAGLTGVGLGEIEPSLRIMELPFMFRSAYEVSLAHEALDPIFEDRLHEEGYELLGWAEVGFVYLFSREPIRTAADLKKMRMWLWDGDPLAQSLLQACGVSPVPLNVTDVLTSLQTGIINTVYATPYACLSLQWFTRLKYMTDLPITHALGAVVVRKKSFDRLSPEEADIVRRVAKDVFGRLLEATREQNVGAMDVVAERNIESVATDATQRSEFDAIGQEVWRSMTGELYDAALLERLTQTLADHRAGS